jgi:DNA (cytosine-5)-methyltransferase 1
MTTVCAKPQRRRSIHIIYHHNLTLGSLFDGIGGFPYAGSFFGIEPLWASEILPQAISVTSRHMPGMAHVGDITKLDGGSLPPVDIITFGSPCQGLSAAGKRQGFGDPRSGLFSEAIRIIYEMREATHGRYPTWAVWENVPGALSSNGGFDFKAVLEAFTKAEVPFPRSGRWTGAGMVRSGGTDLAWCVYNAQYFGTAQRRRRIFLVRDFGGERAGEILFIPKSLQGYFASGGTPRQGAPAYALRGADGAVQDVNCLTPWDTQQSRIFTDDGASPTLAGADGGGGRNPAGLIYTAGFCAGAGAKANGIGYEDETAPTIKGGACGFQMPTVLCAAFMGDSSPSSYGIEYCEESSPTLKPRLSGTPCLCEPKLARTLTARGDGSPNIDSGPNIVTMPKPDEQPDILCAATGQPNAEMLGNLSPTLTCYHEQPIICGAVGVHQNQNGDVNTADTAYSLATTGNATSRNAPLVAHPLISGTLMASGAGMSRPAGMASETDLCVVVPDTEPIPIHDKATRFSGGGDTRKDDGAGNGFGVGKSGDPAPTITAGDRHAIAAVDCRNLRERPELSGTLQAKENGSYSLNYQNPVRMGYIVRRLTPVECERLQGYPDGWTDRGHDGKPISDTARYMMLGNSVAVPCVAYILQGIAAAHRKEA